MHEELKRAVEAAKAHPERLEKNPGNYSTYRRFLATHGDALIAAVRMAEDVTDRPDGANTTNIYRLANEYRTAKEAGVRDV